MGQIAYALIEHALTPKEIFELPERLKSASNTEISGHWCWSNPNFNTALLNRFWKMQFPPDLPNPWSEANLPWLQKDNLTLDFFSPNLVSFDNLSKWFFFQNNESRINEFSKLTQDVAGLLKVIDMIFLPEISDEIAEQHKHLTVDLFRQNCIATKQSFLEVRRNIV